MTIKGRRFRKTTGRSTQARRPSGGAQRLKAWNTPQARKGPDNAAKLRAYQSGLKPIRNRVPRGNPGSAVKQSTHNLYVVEQGPGTYGYVRA